MDVFKGEPGRGWNESTPSQPIPWTTCEWLFAAWHTCSAHREMFGCRLMRAYEYEVFYK